MTTDTLTFEVIAKAKWQIHWAGRNNPGGGIDGQVTHCRLCNGVEFFVREHLARDHFCTSSNHRIALKRGETAGGREVLEVCCPGEWREVVTAIVARADGKRRPIRPNARFTVEWARSALSKGR